MTMTSILILFFVALIFLAAYWVLPPFVRGLWKRYQYSDGDWQEDLERQAEEAIKEEERLREVKRSFLQIRREKKERKRRGKEAASEALERAASLFTADLLAAHLKDRRKMTDKVIAFTQTKVLGYLRKQPRDLFIKVDGSLYPIEEFFVDAMDVGYRRGDILHAVSYYNPNIRFVLPGHLSYEICQGIDKLLSNEESWQTNSQTSQTSPAPLSNSTMISNHMDSISFSSGSPEAERPTLRGPVRNQYI